MAYNTIDWKGFLYCGRYEPEKEKAAAPYGMSYFKSFTIAYVCYQLYLP